MCTLRRSVLLGAGLLIGAVLAMGRGRPGRGFTLSSAADRALREFVEGTREVSWRVSLSWPDQLRAVKGYQVLLECLRSVRSNQPFVPALSRQAARLRKLGVLVKDRDLARRYDV
jgi:hypothetical protein